MTRSETRVKMAQNKSQLTEKLNTFWLVQTVPLRKQIGKKVGQGLQ